MDFSVWLRTLKEQAEDLYCFKVRYFGLSKTRAAKARRVPAACLRTWRRPEDARALWEKVELQEKPRLPEDAPKFPVPPALPRGVLVKDAVRAKRAVAKLMAKPKDQKAKKVDWYVPPRRR